MSLQRSLKRLTLPCKRPLNEEAKEAQGFRWSQQANQLRWPGTSRVRAHLYAPSIRRIRSTGMPRVASLWHLPRIFRSACHGLKSVSAITRHEVACHAPALQPFGMPCVRHTGYFARSAFMKTQSHTMERSQRFWTSARCHAQSMRGRLVGGIGHFASTNRCTRASAPR